MSHEAHSQACLGNCFCIYKQVEAGALVLAERLEVGSVRNEFPRPVSQQVRLTWQCEFVLGIALESSLSAVPGESEPT